MFFKVGPVWGPVLWQTDQKQVQYTTAAKIDRAMRATANSPAMTKKTTMVADMAGGERDTEQPKDASEPTVEDNHKDEDDDSVILCKGVPPISDDSD